MGLRTTKCQLLVTSLCVMLLGLSIAILSTVTHYGLHFTVISNISLESNSYRVIHYAGIFLFCSGLLRIDPSCLLEIHAQHRGGRQHDGCVRFCVRGSEEECLQLQEARADCHPRSIPVLWEALSIWGHDQCRAHDVPTWRGARHGTGLPAEDPGLPEEAHRLCLHTPGHHHRLHGLWDDPDFIPLVLHPLQQQPGPERQIHPAREVETRRLGIPTR
ncbi:tetraspanin-32 isoform X2 [Balearica regulorum gibbericeps]|uniref:tetraspanin-32 isoform X2 n=1 Tax=Balearica regulorum gibbericeps TaxID=100784 RepID=UPI003F60B77D